MTVMTSREIVKRAIHYQSPPRLPVILNEAISDFRPVRLAPPDSFKPVHHGQDEWGCVWEQSEVKNMGQCHSHPLTDLRQLDRMIVPDYSDDSRYQGVEASLRQLEAQGRYITCDLVQVLFERMLYLHGFENCMIDFYEDRFGMEALADRIADVQITFVNEMARRFPGRIDGWNLADDSGTQNAAFVSFDLWMDFFYPRYKRIFDAMHAAGCDVLLHSCGKVNELIEGFIQSGVNMLNLSQPRLLGIAEIGRRYGGRVAFSSLPDVQVTVPTEDRRKIDADIEELMTHWAGPKGGLVFSHYGDGESIGVKDRTLSRYVYERFSDWSRKVYGQPLPELTACPSCNRPVERCWCETLDRIEYIHNWRIIGPFRSPEQGKINLDLPTPVEDAFASLGHGRVDLNAQYPADGQPLTWLPVSAATWGFVDMGKHFGNVEWACAYAYAEVTSDRDEEIILGLGSDDGIKIWLNGEVVYVEETQRSCEGIASMAKATLRKGTNRLLVKIDNYILDWGFLLGVAKSFKAQH
jgi:hypothetical protein